MRKLGEVMTIACCVLAGALWSSQDQDAITDSNSNANQQQNPSIYVCHPSPSWGSYPWWGGHSGFYAGGTWGAVEYYGHPYYHN